MHILIDDAEKRMSAYTQDLKINEDEIEALSSDGLQKLVRSDLKVYNNAATDLLNRKLRINQERVKTKPPQSLAHRAMETCEQLAILAEQLQEAKQYALWRADMRRIKLSKPDYDVKGVISLTAFDGTGSEPLNNTLKSPVSS